MEISPTKKEISCRITRTLLMYVRDKNNGSLGNLLDEMPLDEAYLSDTNNWVSHAFLQILYERMIDLLGDENAVYHMTLASERFQSLGILDRIVRLLGSPKLIYSHAPKYNRFLKLNGSVFIHDIGDSWVVLEDRYHDSTQKTRFDCDYTRGILTGIPTMFGLPLAEVEEIKCQVARERYGKRIWPDHPDQGCEGCLYRVSWLPGKAPFLKRLFIRRNHYRQAIEDLTQANQLIQSKYDEAEQLAADLEAANHALRESEERYRSLVQYAPAGICEFDLEQLRFISVNDVMCEYTGYSKKEFLELNPFDILSDESKQALQELVEEVFSNKVEELATEYKIRGKNQREFWVLANAKFFYEEGLPKRAMAVVHDLTELRRAEAEKRRLEAKLQQAQKMEAIATLAGGIAHDYNNLLSIIMGNLGMARQDAEAGSNQADFLNEAEKAACKVGDLTHELMALSRGGGPIKELGSIGESLKESAHDIPGESGIVFKESIPDDLWLVPYDARKMEAVFRNMVQNAVEAMPRGGTLSITAENLRIDDVNQEPGLTLEAGDYVKITISDRGVGISEEHLDKIFDPYFSTKPMGVQKGMGLGLATAYAIVKRHDGHIAVNSTLGVGTTFSIYLPAAETKVRKEKREEAEVGPASGIRILMMDDEEMLRNLAHQMLKRLGYAVETVKDGAEAIDVYKHRLDSDASFDAVILDLTVKGGMGGEQAIRELLKIDPNATAIVSSGYFNDPVMTDFQKYGFKAAMAKPFEMKDLKETLETVL